jgi:hypothetical protein
MSIIRNLLQRGSLLFYLSRFSAWFSSVFRFRMCFVSDSHFQSFCPKHLAVYLFFISLRSLCSGCYMPFDSFIHSSFQISFCELLLRVINFSLSGISTSLLLRSSVASPGPLSLPHRSLFYGFSWFPDDLPGYPVTSIFWVIFS